MKHALTLSAAFVAALNGGSAMALTMGEVGQQAVAFVEAECGPAFVRHQAGWPDAGAPRDVIWRNEYMLTSDQEIVSDNPDLLDHLPRLTAWQMSGYGLVDDLTLIDVMVAQDQEATEDWLASFRNVSDSLGASVDLYDCARMSDGAFQAAVDDGAGAGLFETVMTFDCLSRIGRQLADAYASSSDAVAVQAAMQPLVDEMKTCGEGG